MATIEPVEIWTGSQWITVQAKLADASSGPLEIWDGANWRALNLVDPAQADTPIEVWDGTQWLGVQSLWSVEIDDFEDSALSEWVDNNNIFSISTANPSSGSRHLEVSTSSTSNAAMNSTTGLPYYPSRGDVIAMDFMLNNAGDNAGYLFGVQETRNTYPNAYHVEVDQRYTDEMRWTYAEPSSGTTSVVGSTPIDLTGYMDQYLELVIEWGSPVSTCSIRTKGGTTLESMTVDESAVSYTLLNAGGVGVSFDIGLAPSTVRIDNLRKLGTV